jgi:hypothetical protein
MGKRRSVRPSDWHSASGSMAEEKKKAAHICMGRMNMMVSSGLRDTRGSCAAAGAARGKQAKGEGRSGGSITSAWVTASGWMCTIRGWGHTRSYLSAVSVIADGRRGD